MADEHETAVVPADCPCPDVRKFLLDTAQDIAKLLLQHLAAQQAAKAVKQESTCPPDADAVANREPCTHCGGTRPCSLLCNCPCHGALGKRTCSETIARDLAMEFRLNPVVKAPAPPDPETVKVCKPQELRAGKFLFTCDCIKRNGLQHDCRKMGCSPKCARLRPARRNQIIIGDAVPTIDTAPRCCPGKHQLEYIETMQKILMERMEAKKRKAEPEDEPPPLPPPLPFNWTGIFPHVCRKPECHHPPKPPKQECTSPNCKHWTVPRPCSYPLCRADCFETPPPRAKVDNLAALTLSLTVKPLDADKEKTCQGYP